MCKSTVSSGLAWKWHLTHSEDMWQREASLLEEWLLLISWQKVFWIVVGPTYKVGAAEVTYNYLRALWILIFLVDKEHQRTQGSLELEGANLDLLIYPSPPEVKEKGPKHWKDQMPWTKSHISLVVKSRLDSRFVGF